MGWYDQIQVQAPQATGYGVAAQLMSESNKGIQDAIKTGGNYFANEAVKKLIADKPSGTVDPTEHIGKVNSLIGYMTPEQAQAYRDYGSAMQTSYGRNLEEGRFNKSQEQSQKQFEENKKLESEKLKEMIRNNNLNYSAQMAQVGLTKEQNKYNRDLHTLELAAKGYVPDGKGGYEFNPEKSASYKAMQAKQINENNEKIIQLASKSTLDDFITGAKTAMNKGWGPALGLTVGSSALSSLYSEASTAINNPEVPQNIRAGLANALIQKNPQGIIDLLSQKYQYNSPEGIKTGIVNPNRVGQTIKPSWGWGDEIEMPKTQQEKSVHDFKKAQQQFVK